MTDEKNAQPDGLPRGVKTTTRGWEIELDYPIEHDGQAVETARIRRPNIGDIETMARETNDENDTSGLIALNNLLARLLGVTEDEIRAADAGDWVRMLEVIKPHLEKLQHGRLI